MIIFGGDTTKTFTFDTRDISSIGNVASVKNSQSTLQKSGRFGVQSDFVGRNFNNIIYMIDSKDMNLHVFQKNEFSWHLQPLRDLMIQ